MTSQSRPGDGRTPSWEGPSRRRRGPVLERAILEAARDELIRAGWDGFSMEAVARAAGTGKSSVYRRWPDKVSLIMATGTLLTTDRPKEAPQLSGDLRADLIDVLRSVGTFLAGPFGDATRALVVERGRRPELGELDARDPVASVVAVLEAAQRSGRLRPGQIKPVVINLGVDLMVHHFLLYGAAPTGAAISELVDDVWLPALRIAP